MAVDLHTFDQKWEETVLQQLNWKLAHKSAPTFMDRVFTLFYEDHETESQMTSSPSIRKRTSSGPSSKTRRKRLRRPSQYLDSSDSSEFCNSSAPRRQTDRRPVWPGL